jgi:hypothetical protein
MLAFVGLSAMISSSCTRGINLTEIEKMPDCAAKDSAMLYYYIGLKAGDLVRTDKSNNPEYNAKSDAESPVYIFAAAEAKYDKNGKMQNAVCQVFRGDTLLILGGYYRTFISKSFMQKAKYKETIKVKAIKNGKATGTGWFYTNSLMPLKHNWAIVFYDSLSIAIILILFGFSVLAVYLLWRLIYWIIVEKIRKEECFWQSEDIHFKWVFLIMSVLIGLMIFYINYNDELVTSLKFNPDFFAHFSEYPLLLKCAPFVGLLWIISIVGMLWEMIKKFKTLWLIFYFAGMLSIGFLCISLIFLASWLLYFILPGLIIFIIAGLGGSGNVKTVNGVQYIRDPNGNYEDPATGVRYRIL